jgi:peptidoglycan/LPS O-acetylase OafA/YrhL
VTAKSQRFPLVDSMRAIAAISVLLLHVAAYADKLGPQSLGHQYLQRLDVGVWIFFVISGFVLFRPFARAHLLGEPAPKTAPYAWRRALRIVPPFWVALAISAIFLPGLLYWRNAPYAFGFAQIYRSNTTGIGITPAWTLCIEVTFYAFLPLYSIVVGYFARKPGAWLRAEVAGLALLFAVSLLWQLWAYGGAPGHHHDVLAGNFLPGRLDLFSLGMGLAVVQLWSHEHAGASRMLRVIDRFPILPWLIALIAFWVVSAHAAIPQVGTYNTWSSHAILAENYLYAVVAIGLVAPAVLGDPGRGVMRKVLAHRWLVWLGLVSYGTYLWQVPWLLQLQRWGMHPSSLKAVAPWMVLGFGGAIGLGAVSYYLVERPALSLRRLVGKPPHDSTGGSPELAPALDR